jgi:hypothetical protein
MALAIDQTVQAQVLPTAPHLVLSLHKSALDQPQESNTPATSKGKMFSKDAPTITPAVTTSTGSEEEAEALFEMIEANLAALASSTDKADQADAKELKPVVNLLKGALATIAGKGAQAPATTETKAASPITPITPADQNKLNLIAMIALMMTVIQGMEILINKLMATASKCENAMMLDASHANVASEKSNIALAEQQYQDEEAAKRRSGIMKILGYIAAALVCVVSIGTMTAVAALLVVAVVIVDQLGLLDKGVNAMLKGMGVDPDSTLGKVLGGIIKLIIMILAAVATGGAAAAETGAEAGEEAGASAATSTTAAATDNGAEIEMTDLSQNAEEAADDGAAESSEASKASDASKAAKNPKWEAAKFAAKVQVSGMLGSLDPLSDFAVAIKRAAVGGKDDTTEQWITMVSQIVEALAGMALMFTSIQSAENNAGAFSKLTDNAQTIAKIKTGLMTLTSALDISSAALGIDVGTIKLDKADIENQIADVKEVTTELKTLVEMLQSIAQDQQKWMKQNSDLDKQLNDSFQYDEFSSFASVQLHG